MSYPCYGCGLAGAEDTLDVCARCSNWFCPPCLTIYDGEQDCHECAKDYAEEDTARIAELETLLKRLEGENAALRERVAEQQRRLKPAEYVFSIACDTCKGEPGHDCGCAGRSISWVED